MFMHNGKRLPVGSAFTIGGTQYPANWLSLSSMDEKLAIGISEVVEGARPDDRFYWVQDNNDGTFTATPKELNDAVGVIGLKTVWIGTVKGTAGSLLAPTDWKVIRASEGGPAVDVPTSTFRTAVRAKSNEVEAAIVAATTVEALITAVSGIVWPTL